PGDNKSKANLSFISENTVVVEYAKLIISTVPSKDNTEYRFPCGLARGSVTIGWRKAEDGRDGRDRACNEGLRVGPGVGKQSYRPNLNYRDGLQASKKILLAQSFGDVIVVPPDSGSRFLQAVANENGTQIITLQGDILVKSEKHPQGRLIPEGNQYSYPQDTITPINCQGIANSPEIQELLNNNNWSYPDISQRVTDEIANQIAEHRAGLCRASRPESVAQNNYCNSRTVTQPTFSSNSHDGTPYRIWMDFSRGQEVSSAVCGRQYWVKEDPNHPNNQIRFVYLVDGQGKCVVPYLYKETGGGNLEVVRPAPECSSGS
ncbi:hypothetical protein, partial [Microcoleus anatoxicus]|uniref:hypothetical protein n=1 Tax=Microcoleus anatoxicus TaxID=2705319 RepID=UPI0030C92D6C